MAMFVHVTGTVCCSVPCHSGRPWSWSNGMAMLVHVTVTVCCSVPCHSGGPWSGGGRAVAVGVVEVFLPFRVRAAAGAVCWLPHLQRPLLHTFW